MVKNISAPVPKVFLRIKYSSPRFQNNILPGIKAIILRHKEVSSMLLLEADVRKPGSKWLEQKGNL